MPRRVIGLSFWNAILLRPPVARDPERLVTLYTVAHNGAKESFSYPEYRYIRDHNQGFSGVAALNYGFYKYDASFGKRHELATLDVVSDKLFRANGDSAVPRHVFCFW